MQRDLTPSRGIIWHEDAGFGSADYGAPTAPQSRPRLGMFEAHEPAAIPSFGGHAEPNPAALPARRPLPVVAPDASKIAVILNANARKVTRTVQRRIWRLMGKEHVYYSRSIEEAEAFVREVVQKGYGTLVCGGGDGTITNLINMLYRYIDEANEWRRMIYKRTGEVQPLLGYPNIGSLKLGTGNGLSGVLGTSNPLRDLVQVLEGNIDRTIPVPLIESEGEYFFFAGLGYDAQLLNDYNWIKDNFNSPFTKPFSHGLQGYFSALFTRMLPRAVTSGATVEMRIINTGDNCYYVDPRRGDRLTKIPRGTVVHEGPVSIVGVATTPYYGYGLRLYPFSGMSDGLMQMRISDLKPVRALTNLPSIWRGHYRSFEHIKDFITDSVRVEVARPFPYQHSGEGKGYREEVEFKVSERRVNFIDFYPPALQ